VQTPACDPAASKNTTSAVTAVVVPARWNRALAAAACTGAVLVMPADFAPLVRCALLIAGAAIAFDLARVEARRPGDPRPIVWSIAGLLTLAVLMPMRFGTDVWSYTMVGRLITVHRASPYLHAVGHFSNDPLLHLVLPGWRHGTAPYGPLFLVQTAGVALVAGTHALLYRLAYQLAAAAAVGASLWVLWRTNRSTAALALVGLQPLVAGPIVNGGHNDALIALAALGAVLLVARGRHRSAGWVLAVAVLLKLTAGAVVIPLLVWVGLRHGGRALLRLGAPSVLVALPLTLFVPGCLDSVRGANDGVITRMSLWNLPLRKTWFPYHELTPERLGRMSLLVVVGIVVVVTLIGAFQREPGSGVVMASSAWLVAGAYVVPWYSMLPLPTAALRPTSRLSAFITFQATAMTVAWSLDEPTIKTVTGLDATIRYVLPVLVAAMFVWAISPLLTSPSTRRTSPTSTA
jgi:hypothetical protein